MQKKEKQSRFGFDSFRRLTLLELRLPTIFQFDHGGNFLGALERGDRNIPPQSLMKRNS